ncbi:hypothetical protein CLV58_13145 [Spirosoma oryzae]|uniref:Uncharacterized protein n=1 Tax=Spirosoma oryzae TaxID=1469603 RepID=A0A2T0S342_9BACT|nr:hypothetical protein [Spirosoma oryzae]PRY27827.1 hypothetical protein CLV58_13145 [Spirosoma oryzae]
MPFKLSVLPQRVTTTQVYTLRWRSLSALTGNLTVNGTELPADSLYVLNTLTPQLRVRGRSQKLSKYTFNVMVTNQAGQTQELPLSIILKN